MHTNTKLLFTISYLALAIHATLIFGVDVATSIFLGYLVLMAMVRL